MESHHCIHSDMPELHHQPMGKAMLMEDCMCESAPHSSYDMNMEPDDIEVSDTVTVILEIC